MPTYQPAPDAVKHLAESLCAGNHAPLLEHDVKIDFVFAFADIDDESGEKLGDAIRSRGFRVFGQARKMPLKDRVMGRGDAEILLDGDYWGGIPDAERAALLDHELQHLEVQTDERGVIIDDLGRPKLKLRRHDVETGWFHAVAKRNGKYSIERKQAAQIMDTAGQWYWPELAKASEQAAQAEGSVTISGPGIQPVTVSTKRFTQIAEGMTK